MRVYRLAGTVVGTEDSVLMDMLGMEYISAKQIHDYLEDSAGEDIIFNLNSGGGSVLAGSEIYTMLKSYKGHITVNITGLSASIASVFMLGADEVNISHQAQIMIHQPRVALQGNVDSLEVNRISNMLNSTEKSLVSVYKLKTGLPEDKILEMMFNETWLNAEEAKELGFVDNIMQEDDGATNVAEELVAMVHSADRQLSILKELKNMKGSNMEKTFLEKVRSLVNGTTEVVEDTEVKEVESATEEVEEKEEEQTEEQAPVVEEVHTVDADTATLLEKAVNEIETLRAENEELKTKLQDLQASNEKLVADNASLSAKDSKSQDMVAKLNALLNSEESKLVTVTQGSQAKASEFPVGYKGIRGGNN